MAQDLKTANDLVNYEEFYLPCNFDFRGRVYPIPTFSPHRDDHIKAMFYLANVRPITRRGFEWLCVHLANVGDFEKISKRALMNGSSGLMTIMIRSWQWPKIGKLTWSCGLVQISPFSILQRVLNMHVTRMKAMGCLVVCRLA